MSNGNQVLLLRITEKQYCTVSQQPSINLQSNIQLSVWHTVMVIHWCRSTNFL